MEHYLNVFYEIKNAFSASFFYLQILDSMCLLSLVVEMLGLQSKFLRHATPIQLTRKHCILSSLLESLVFLLSSIHTIINYVFFLGGLV